MTSSQRTDEAKVIGTKGTTQTRNQACCLRRNDMTRKIDVSLARCRKLCSGKKGPGSTVKIYHDNDMANQARNDLKD